MILEINGKTYEIEQGQSILEVINQYGLNSDSLAVKPLASRIGGEVYNLGFRPNKPLNIELLYYGDDEGFRVYERTLLFILVYAVRRIFPGAKVKIRYSFGQRFYIDIEKTPAFSESDALELETECHNIVKMDIPLIRRRLDIKEAISFFEADGQLDKAELLKWRNFNYFDVYMANDYVDYFYGEMTPSTGYITTFALKYNESALALMLPKPEEPDRPREFVDLPKLMAVYHRSDTWGKLLGCNTAMDLNRSVTDGSIRELVRINEALHEKTYAEIADSILDKKARAVLVSGPSSSGKTTSANRIATQLRVLGLDPIMLSLDDYYLDHDVIPTDEKGEQDLESIYTLDIPRFSKDFAELLNGQEVEIPQFDFASSKRSPKGKLLRIRNDQPLIIEGIHGHNPLMLGEHINSFEVFKVYVSALTTLNLDDHNRIRSTDVRLLRRLVRDFNTRGSDIAETLSMWPSVRRGEDIWISPFQEQADAIFNSALVYELAVLKKYVYPLLLRVEKENTYYMAARNIVKFLNYFLDTDIEDEIPPTSILREFIGGNTFYK